MMHKPGNYRAPIGGPAGSHQHAPLHPLLRSNANGSGARRWLLSSSQRPAAAAPRGPCARVSRSARVEAVLFAAYEPLHPRRISQFAGLADPTEARTLIRQLNQWYDDSGSAFRVEEVAGGFQLLTRRKFAGWLRRLRDRASEPRMSTPALETLAVIAYRQPVTRAQIEAIRGVQCGEMLRQLIERDLVRIAGRSDELGHPFLYGTTRLFLQTFGLRDLTELPPLSDAVHSDLSDSSLTEGSSKTVQPDEGRDQALSDSPDLHEEPPVRVVLAKEHDVPEDAEEILRLRPNSPLIASDEGDEEEDFEEDDDEESDDAEDDEEDDEDEDWDDDADDDFEDDDWEEVDEDDEEWDEEDDDEEEEDEEEDDEWDDDEDEDWEEDDEEEEEEK